MDVLKAGGQYAQWDFEKLRHSLMRSGVSEQQAAEIIRRIEPKIHDRMPTREISRMAYQELKRLHRSYAARYNLKKAMRDLGPTGFPFENLVSQILKSQGYEVMTGQFFEGRCVTHEVDVVARNNGTAALVECKYHNSPGVLTNIKTPLYVYARFLDIRDNWDGSDAPFPMVATNTRFSEDAIRYSQCSEIRLLGWDYPHNNGIREWIDKRGLYPLTCLTTLTAKEKSRLLEKNFVLAKELLLASASLSEVGLTDQRIEGVKREIESM